MPVPIFPRRVILLDKNRQPGIKILLSGGTRCNLTHDTDVRGIVAAFGPAGRFLHSALAALGPQDVVELFAAEGVPTKVEPGGKVFPASDRASDVLAALLRRVKRSGCELALAEPLVELQRHEAGFQLTTPRRVLHAKKVLLATGGQSYPACGTTGDGYRWAAALGHTIVTPRTALVPVTSHAPWVRELQGITVPDVAVFVVEADETNATRKVELPGPRSRIAAVRPFRHHGPRSVGCQPRGQRILLPEQSPAAMRLSAGDARGASWTPCCKAERLRRVGVA